MTDPHGFAPFLRQDVYDLTLNNINFSSDNKPIATFKHHIQTIIVPLLSETCDYIMYCALPFMDSVQNLLITKWHTTFIVSL